jgi:hypothetical protein
VHEVECQVLYVPGLPVDVIEQAATRVQWILDTHDFSGEYGLALKAAALHTLAVARLRQERFSEVEPLCEPGLAGSFGNWQARKPRAWCRDRGWRDWPQLFGQYAPPSERDLTLAPHLRASLLVQAPVPLDRLSPAPAGPADDAPATARLAVAAVVRELNDLLAPVISQLERATPAR